MSYMGMKRPQLPAKNQLGSIQTGLLRRTLADKIDREAESKYAKEKLKPTPETVSSSSTMHPVFGAEHQAADIPREVDMMAGMRSDLVLSRGRPR
jgi:hypothetical protein